MAVTPNSIITPQTVKTAYAVTSTANTTMGDTPTNSALLMTAGINGARVTRISAMPRATFAGDVQLQLFLSKDAGVTKRFLDSEKLTAYTMAATTKAQRQAFSYSDDNPLMLEAGDRLYVAAGVTGDIAWAAEYGDY